MAAAVADKRLAEAARYSRAHFLHKLKNLLAARRGSPREFSRKRAFSLLVSNNWDNHYLKKKTPRAGNLNQILRCDWLPMELCCPLGTTRRVPQEHYEENHVINPTTQKKEFSKYAAIFAELRWFVLLRHTISTWQAELRATYELNKERMSVLGVS